MARDVAETDGVIESCFQENWITANFTVVRVVATGSAVRRKINAASGDRVARPAQGSGSLLRFYTDESPGLKITPVVVLGMSVCFIGFVTMLHAIAKIASYMS